MLDRYPIDTDDSIVFSKQVWKILHRVIVKTLDRLQSPGNEEEMIQQVHKKPHTIYLLDVPFFSKFSCDVTYNNSGYIKRIVQFQTIAWIKLKQSKKNHLYKLPGLKKIKRNLFTFAS